MPPIDLTTLTWDRFFVVALAVAFVDFVVGTLAAIVPPNAFSWASVAHVLESHVLKRVIPVSGLAFVALSLPAGPEHDGVWLAACGGLALYMGETIKSLVTSVGTAQDMADEIPMTDGAVPDDEPDA